MFSNKQWPKSVALALAVASPAAMAAPVGKVMFVFGTANLERNGISPLTKGLGLEARDKVITGNNGRAQLKMIDNSKVALRPDSEFVVQEIVRAATGTAQVAATSQSGDKAVYQLLKGGLRTLTGDIGGAKGGEYQLKTPVATMGIRGTAYSAVLAAPEECLNAGASGGSSAISLYVTVSDGGVYVENDAGRLNLDPGEFACVTGINAAPVLLLKPPAALANEARALAGDGEDSSGDAAAEDARVARQPPGAFDGFNNRNQRVSDSGEIEFEDPVIEITAGEADFTDGGSGDSPIQRSATFSLPAGAPGARSNAQRDSATTIQTASNGDLLGIEQANGDRYDIGTASNINTGEDGSSGLRWGRWTGGIATRTDADSNSTDIDLNSSSVHWVLGPAGDVVLPTTGSRSFSVAGNTSPTDQAGAVGTFGNATLSANFDNATVETSVNFSLNGQVWEATGGTAAIAGSTFNGNYANVTAGQVAGDGQFSGFFGNNADSAGLTYGLNVDNENASGAVTFTSP